MNVQDLIEESAALFNNKKFDEAIEKLNQALDGIEDKNSQIQEQNEIQAGLGLCYFEQAKQAVGGDSEQETFAKKPFPPAAETQKQVFGCFLPQSLLILPKYSP